MEIKNKTFMDAPLMEKILTKLFVTPYIIFMVLGVVDLVSSIMLTILGKGFSRVLGIILILLGLLLLLLPFINMFAIKSAIKKDKELNKGNYYEYWFTPTYMRIQIDDVVIQKPYAKLRKIISLKDYLLIYENNSIAYVVDKTLFNETENEQVLTWCGLKK